MDIHFVYMWQFVTIVLLTRTGINLCSENTNLMKHKCITINTKQHCFWLYQSTGGITWEAAKMKCLSMNLAFATLEHQDIINMMQMFTQSIIHDGNTQIHVWVAGKRKTNDTFYAVPNAAVSTFSWPDYGGDICMQDNEQTTCGMLRISTQMLYRCRCNRQALKLKAICAHPVNDQTSQDGQCDGSDGYMLGAACYHTTEPLTWYEASTYCAQTFPGSYLDVNVISNENKGILQELFGTDESDSYIWIGLERRPWTWDTGTFITQFKWYAEEGDDRGNTCLHLEPTQEGKWADKACTDSSNYFICQNVTPISRSTRPTGTATVKQTTTSTTTSGSTTTTTTISTPTSGAVVSVMETEPSRSTFIIEMNTTFASSWKSDRHTSPAPSQVFTTSQTAEQTSAFENVYIIPIVIGIFIILLVVIIPVICMRYKKRKSKDSNPSPYTYGNSVMVTGYDDPEEPYMITPGPYDPTAPKLSNDYDLAGHDVPPLSNPSNNETDPAELYSKPNKSGTGAHGNSIKGVMSHKTAKSGDIYSLPNKSTVDEDSGEGPSEPYSLPQKSGRQEEEDDLEDVIMDNPTYGSMQ